MFFVFSFIVLYLRYFFALIARSVQTNNRFKQITVESFFVAVERPGSNRFEKRNRIVFQMELTVSLWLCGPWQLVNCALAENSVLCATIYDTRIHWFMWYFVELIYVCLFDGNNFRFRSPFTIRHGAFTEQTIAVQIDVSFIDVSREQWTKTLYTNINHPNWKLSKFIGSLFVSNIKIAAYSHQKRNEHSLNSEKTFRICDEATVRCQCDERWRYFVRWKY